MLVRSLPFAWTVPNNDGTIPTETDMRLKTIKRTMLATMLASAYAVSTARAHETGAEQRGKELFQPGLEHAAKAASTMAAGRPTLYDGLGSLTFPVTTASAEAQAYFNQGWVLTWGFNHAEALRSFREARRLDPGFAMAYWGEALVQGANINDIMHDEAVAPAYEAIQKAKALSGGVSDKERALIEALAKRYGPAPVADRSGLETAWADALKAVAASYMDDANVQVLYAEALMNLQPWDYWEADGRTPKKNAAAIVSALEQALKIDPEHPGAMHLYIHAVEASANPGRAEAVADRLRGKVPAAGHLTHMPSHIYIRIGRHADSIAVNANAIAADEAMVEAAGKETSALYRFGYYPHNVHFLLVSAQMSGVKDKVFEAAEKLANVTSDEVSQQLAWVQAIKTAPLTAHAQFGDAGTIEKLPRPDDAFPFVQGFWHYARGVASAQKGDTDGAAKEAAAIGNLIANADMSTLEAQYLPAKNVLGIAKHVVEARIAQAFKDYATAEAHLREAAEMEKAIPYTEPPYWYYPVRQTLGAVQLQQGKAEEAAETFKAALKERPRNAWALWGLMQAQKANGDAAAAATEAAFEKAWLGDRAMLSLDRL
jgi:tetratricopeptide (TPR) repeat protein